MAAKQMAIARSIIIQALGYKPLRAIMSEKTNPSNIWNKWTERYATSTATRRVQVQTRRHQMHFVNTKSMSEYIDELEAILHTLEGMECEVQETMKVAKLLESLGNKSESPYGAVNSAFQTLSEENRPGTQLQFAF